MESSLLQDLPFYGRITETLKRYQNTDPTWKEIVNALTALNEDGSYASVLGAFEAYYDEKGFVKNLMRLDIQGMQSTPKIVLEELNVSEIPESDDLLNIEYVSFDENGMADVASESIEREYCAFEPGEYVTIAFTFNSRQSYTKKHLFNALENYYAELEKLDEKELEGIDDASHIQIPVLTIVAVPLLFGGKYSLHLVNPVIWNWLDDEENKDANSETLVVAFERKDVHFAVDDEADPAETYKKCRSELASEWMRESQRKRLEAEEEAYEAMREEEIRKMANISTKHAFKTSKDKWEEK